MSQEGAAFGAGAAASISVSPNTSAARRLTSTGLTRMLSADSVGGGAEDGITAVPCWAVVGVVAEARGVVEDATAGAGVAVVEVDGRAQPADPTTATSPIIVSFISIPPPRPEKLI